MEVLHKSGSARQGCMKSNNNPELIRQYGGQMTFMGDIDNKFVDFNGWTPADCEKATLASIERCNSILCSKRALQKLPGRTVSFGNARFCVMRNRAFSVKPRPLPKRFLPSARDKDSPPTGYPRPSREIVLFA